MSAPVVQHVLCRFICKATLTGSLLLHESSNTIFSFDSTAASMPCYTEMHIGILESIKNLSTAIIASRAQFATSSINPYAWRSLPARRAKETTPPCHE